VGRLLVKVLGGAGEVGRAAVLVKSLETGTAVLLDYGVNFDEQDRPLFPQHVRPRDITCVALSHAHLDHCGSLPSLFVSYELALYATPLTIELSDLLIKDLLKLSGYYLPYEHREVSKMLECTVPVTYGEVVEVAQDLTLTFLNAGHVPGSSMILIEMDGWRILYTGDFNSMPTCLLNGADLSNIPRDVDLVIMEGTYVNGSHPPREVLERQLVEITLSVLEEGGCVLIPSFTVGRSQEVLSILVKYGIDTYPIIVDGLARIANEIIARYPHYLRDYKLYKRAMEVAIEVPSEYFRRNVGSEPCIVISPAGMLKGGAVIQYLKKLSKNRKNAIILPSFQAPGTPGFQILTKGKAIVDNKEIKIDAQIYWLDLSAHAGKRELEDFIRRFNTDTRIIMVHTTLLNALKFVTKLKQKHGIDNVMVPRSQGETIVIEKTA